MGSGPELPTLDVTLGDPNFHPLHPCLSSNVWEYRGQRVIHLFQVGQERELEREVVCPNPHAQDS